MVAGLIASLLFPAVVGVALCRKALTMCTPGTASPDGLAAAILTGGLALPFGIGTCSCLYFVWLTVSAPPAAGLAVFESALGLVLVVLLVRSARRGPETPADDKRPGRPRIGLAPWLPWVLVVTATSAAAAFAMATLLNPHGSWDAWMTWNLGARFLFRGGDLWTRAFSETLRHPDYPLLLQGAVARAWYYARTDSLAAPAIVGGLFTAATVAITWAAVALLRSRSEAHVAALMLLGTTFLALHGASQYADVPVGCYFLMAIVLLWLHDLRPGSIGLVALAGLATGLSAWTKNEGLMFLPVLIAARLVAVSTSGGARRWAAEMKWFALGAAPVLLIILYFKAHFAPANYLLEPEDHGVALTLGRLLDVGRYRFLAGAVKHELLNFRNTGLAGPIWLAAAYLLCVGVVRSAKSAASLRMSILVGCLMALGHLLVLLIAPGDMPRLASASLNRLMLQLWPAAVFTCFMVTTSLPAGTPEPSVRVPQWT